MGDGIAVTGADVPPPAAAAASIPASEQGRPGERAALAIGVVGALGEALRDRLLADARYRAVYVAVRAAMPSALPRFAPLPLGDGPLPETAPEDAPRVDDAFLCVTGAETSVPARAVARRLARDEVVAAARLARACGARRLALVSPLAALLQIGALARGVTDGDEMDLVQLGFDSLLIVRPTAAEAAGPGGGPLQAAARWAGRALLSIMLPQDLHLLDPDATARAIVAAAAATGPGVRIVGARELAALADKRAGGSAAPGETR